MNEDDYQKDLKSRQEEHLKNVRSNRMLNWRPCMHDQCSECVGTGITKDGSRCIHMMSCPCPKCTPWCSYSATGKGSVLLFRDSITIEPVSERPMLAEPTNDLRECWPQ
jgi:hypothetical protein